jgi:hypothetical protein
MAQTVCVILGSSDRQQLEVIVTDRNRPKKHAERAQTLLATTQGEPVQRMATRLGVGRPMVWRWQQRFAEAGVDGLLRDKTRNSQASKGESLARTPSALDVPLHPDVRIMAERG